MTKMRPIRHHERFIGKQRDEVARRFQNDGYSVQMMNTAQGIPITEFEHPPWNIRIYNNDKGEVTGVFILE